MSDNPLRDTFAWHRARGATALEAIRRARVEVASGKRRYGASSPRVAFNPPFTRLGESHLRWVENADAGLRLVGFVDEIDAGGLGRRGALVDHRGWYTSDDNDLDETLRGVVYRLPARHGRERFAFGYADPNNDGAALLSFDPCDDLRDAILWADRLAERSAESERDYNRAWRAGRRFEDLGDAVAEARSACLALIREARAACPSIAALPAVKAAIRARVESLVDGIREARGERARLLADYGREPAFTDG